MSMLDQVLVRSRILSTLPPTEYLQLRPSLEQVALHATEVLFAPGDNVRYIYFPNDAVVSLMFGVDGRRPVEAAMEGNEGAVGFAVYLAGARSCNLAVVRDAGTAMRMDVNVLTRCADQHSCLQDLLSRYLHALVTQVAQAGVCNQFHSVEARLARWLLMTQDRVGSSKICATQESIAHMLGIRRSSVTAAARGFLQRDTINYRRGQIEIVDQRGLTGAACSCYGIIKSQYDNFLK